MAIGTWLLWRVRTPEERRPGEDLPEPPKVSVIVPARNEETALPHLLRSLAAQDPPPHEVVVVDDHSTDGTSRVASQAGARVIPSDPLPSGWTGKTWALQQGAAAAGGDLFLFLDADVTLRPGGLAAVVAECSRHGGLVSVQPHHVPGLAYERLSSVCNAVVLMGTGAFCAWPRQAPALAFGPCLALSREDYAALGGHGHPQVRGMVAEDIGLARLARSAGMPVTVLSGGDKVVFRMYPDGPRQMVDGWSKMLATGVRAAPPLATAGVVLWIGGALLAALRLGAGVRGDRGWLAYLAWAAHMRWVFGRVGDFGFLTALAFPAPLVTFLGVFARAEWQAACDQPAVWRGRVVPSQRKRL